MSSRYVLILAYAKWNTANTAQRFYNEIQMHSLLHRGGVNVVPLVGAYSTNKSPPSLVYEYMEGRDLKQYLLNQPNVGRLELVIASHTLSSSNRPSDASR